MKLSPLLDFVLNACSEVDINFVLLEFVLLRETMKFYWIIHVDPTMETPWG